jgi:hypothetical protein
MKLGDISYNTVDYGAGIFHVVSYRRAESQPILVPQAAVEPHFAESDCCWKSFWRCWTASSPDQRAA